jgi:exopolysaccharide production protein ExoQ
MLIPFACNDPKLKLKMPLIALTVSLIFSTSLIVRDCLRRRMVSTAVWIPTILVIILSSRPLSLWLTGSGPHFNAMGNDSSTSFVDQLFYFSVLGSSLLIASLRGMRWSKLLTANSAIMFFYLYFALSVSWSGDPAGSLKRLAKDFGLLFVVSVILTEKNPLQAMRAVYVRSAFLLLPLSVVFIKWFPDLGRAYGIAGEPMATGVTTQKNSLGEIVLVFTLFMFWDYLESRPDGAKFRIKKLPWDLVVLTLCGIWLLHLSQSKTALVCTMVGIFLIWRKGRLAKRSISLFVLAAAITLPFVVYFSSQFASVLAPLIEALGRNMTFTGRTNIWGHITLQTVNPMIGAGYWNFWGGPGGLAIMQAMLTSIPNAHNGYVDIYLDGGICGLVALFFMLLVCGGRLVRYINRRGGNSRFQKVRFAVLIALIIYNLSESTFARMGPIWFTALLMMVDYPLPPVASKKKMPPQQQLQSGEVEQSLAMAHL